MKLRLAGRSYNEIHKELDVPKSTLSGWFKDVVLSEKARRRLVERSRTGSAILIQRNKAQTHHARQRAKKAQKEGKKRIRTLLPHDLLLLGTVLYWAEGYKRPIVQNGKERTAHVISFLNTDPIMIAAFVRFLVQALEIPKEKIKLTMRLYPHINEEEARRYWMRASGLLESSFQRSTIMVSGATKKKRPFNRLPYGTLCVSVSDTPRFHHLIGLIEGVKDKLVRDTMPPLLG